MKYFLVLPIAVVAVVLLVAAPAFGGGIRGTNNQQNSVQNKNINDLVISSEEVRRILDDAVQGPIIREDCADTVGLIEVSAEGTMSNCRKIRKNRLCERQHNGKHLYESCEKSCGICVEPIPTTDAPTTDLVGLTDMPTVEPYNSSSPTQYPTSTITEPPTESPSRYPTTSPTTLVPISIIWGNETAEPTYEAILNATFDSTVDPAKYQSASPSLTPTIKFTDEPTEAPSHYPTLSPTEDEAAKLMDGLDDDVLLTTLGEAQ